MQIGHNNPPLSADDILCAHDALTSEVAAWLDGQPVETEEQMKQVDDMIHRAKELKKNLNDGKEAVWRPLKTAADDEAANWNAHIKDADDNIKGLNELQTPYKLAREAERMEAEGAAREKALRLEREAKAAQEAASMANLEERRKADEIADQAREARLAQQEIADDKTGGLRTFNVVNIDDPKALINWIASNDKAALMKFMESYVGSKRTIEEKRTLPGVSIKQERRAS